LGEEKGKVKIWIRKRRKKKKEKPYDRGERGKVMESRGKAVKKGIGRDRAEEKIVRM